MEKLIHCNSSLIKKVLGDLGVSNEILSNMIKIYSLKRDFTSIDFSKEEGWWKAEITLKNRINSRDEFEKYLKSKGIIVKDNTMSYGDEIYRPDYILAMSYDKGSSGELECNFYNPGKIKHKSK